MSSNENSLMIFLDIFPGVSELADDLDLGSSVYTTYGFKSHHPDQPLNRERDLEEFSFYNINTSGAQN